MRILLRAVLAIVACGATGALAQVGVPATGATLYTTPSAIAGGVSCQNCHAFSYQFRDSRFAGLNEAAIRARIQTAINNNAGQIMGVYSAWTPQQISDVAAHLQAVVTPPPPPPFAPLPTPTAAPSPVMFGSTAVGATSATIAILLTNSAGAAVTLGNPHVAPATGQVGDFRSATVPAGQTACLNGATLQPGMSCSIGAQFAPTAAGSRTATWNVNFSGNVPARTLTLEGTATSSAAPPPATTPAPTGSANSPSNAGAGALGWMNLLGLLALLGVARYRRR